MLRPAMTQILKPGESYYKFVVAVAKKPVRSPRKRRKTTLRWRKSPSPWRWISLPPVRSVFPILIVP